MATPSVADLVKVLHANIDSIHKTLSSLPDPTAHETHISSLENELENHLATLHKQHEEETQSLTKLRQKHESELAEQRASEEREILERRKREDEERRSRLEAEELERRRMIEDEDKQRAIQRQEAETKKREEVESEVERLEEEMERKVEESKVKLRDLDGERKSINARIDAMLNTPTVFPEFKFRRRDRGQTLVNPLGEVEGSLVAGIKGLDLNNLNIEEPKALDIPVHGDVSAVLAEYNTYPEEIDVQDVLAGITGKVEKYVITGEIDTDHALEDIPHDIDDPSIYPLNTSTGSISTQPDSAEANFIPTVEALLSPFKEKVNVFDYQIPGSEAISVADPEEVMTEPAEDPEDIKARAEIAKINAELFKTVEMEESASEIPEEDGEMEMEISEDRSERPSSEFDSEADDALLEGEEELTLRASELALHVEAGSLEYEPDEEVTVLESSQIVAADTDIPILEEQDTHSVLDTDMCSSRNQSASDEDVHLDAAETIENKVSIASNSRKPISSTEHSESPAEEKAITNMPADSHENVIPAAIEYGSHEFDTNVDVAGFENKAMHGGFRNAEPESSESVSNNSGHKIESTKVVDRSSYIIPHKMKNDEPKANDSLDGSESDKENVGGLLQDGLQNIADDSLRSFGAERDIESLDSVTEGRGISQAPSEQGVLIEKPATTNKKSRDMESIAESPATVLAADSLFETDYEDDENGSSAEANMGEDDIAHQAFVKEAYEPAIPVIETQNAMSSNPANEQVSSGISPNEGSSSDHDEHFEISPQTGDETSPLGPAINITAATPNDNGLPDSPPNKHKYAQQINNVIREQEQEPLSGYLAGDSEGYSPEVEVREGKGRKMGIFAGLVHAVNGDVPLVRQLIGDEVEGGHENIPPVEMEKGVGVDTEHESVFDSDSESEQHFHESSEGLSLQHEETSRVVSEPSSSGSEDSASDFEKSESYRQNLPPAPTPPYNNTHTGPTVPAFEHYANSEEDTPRTRNSFLMAGSQRQEAEDPFQDPPELKILSSPISPASKFQGLTASFYDPSLNATPTSHQEPRNPIHNEESPQSAVSLAPSTSERETFAPHPLGLSTRFLSDLQNAESPSSVSPPPCLVSNPSLNATPHATQSSLSASTTTSQSPLLYTNQPTPTPTPSTPSASSRPPFLAPASASPSTFQKTRSLFETSAAPPSLPSSSNEDANGKPRPTSAILRSESISARNPLTTSPTPPIPTKRASLSSLWPGKLREGYGDEEEEVFAPSSSLGFEGEREEGFSRGTGEFDL
ncbi:hypothetical protein B7494_g7926 [Chlorociboria aeruginascens]|nr:hypothetical protein B7494_g7926 [Chlorociboria aeruginascens]